jgi:hypothetical protein
VNCKARKEATNRSLCVYYVFCVSGPGVKFYFQAQDIKFREHIKD